MIFRRLFSYSYGLAYSDGGPLGSFWLLLHGISDRYMRNKTIRRYDEGQYELTTVSLELNIMMPKWPKWHIAINNDGGMLFVFIASVFLASHTDLSHVFLYPHLYQLPSYLRGYGNFLFIVLSNFLFSCIFAHLGANTFFFRHTIQLGGSVDCGEKYPAQHV